MLKHSAIYFAGRFGAALVTLLSVAIYTRLLSPAEYGVYALVLSGAMAGYAIVLQWLTFALVRFLPAYQGREEVVLSHAVAAYGSIALLVLAGGAVLVPWVVPAAETRTVVLLGIVIFVTLSFAELNLVTFQMKGLAYQYVRFAFLRVSVAAVVGVTLAYLGWGSTGALVGLVAGHLCIAMPNLYRVWGSIRRSLLRRSLFTELAAYGLPFAVSGAVGAVINASDRYIIGILLGTDAAGLYAAPYDLAMRTLHMAMMVIATASGPFIFRAYESDGEAAARPFIGRQVELLLGLALPAAIAFALLAPAIARVFLGAAFQAPARELMPWIATATLLQGFQSFYLALSFSLTKRPLPQTGVLALGALLNVILNLLLIPRLGLVGAALATVASYVLIVVGSFLLGRSLLALPFPMASFIKILGACAVMALILWPVSGSTALPQVVIHGVAGAVAYLVICCSLDVGETRRPVLQLASAMLRGRRASLEQR